MLLLPSLSRLFLSLWAQTWPFVTLISNFLLWFRPKLLLLSLSVFSISTRSLICSFVSLAPHWDWSSPNMTTHIYPSLGFHHHFSLLGAFDIDPYGTWIPQFWASLSLISTFKLWPWPCHDVSRSTISVYFTGNWNSLLLVSLLQN